MDASKVASAIANSSAVVVDAVESSVSQLRAAETSLPSTFGLFGRVVLAILRVIPSILYWIITVTTITLPTWLFTLFSMSLTFTMNFTTL
jgi:lysophospholipid hydrolase